MAISKVIYKESANATPVVWMDTTDKTADSGNMLNGITALKNDGTTATGSIQSQAAQTIYPSTSDQTIASGKYLTGAQTIKGVLLTNLSAGNIKKDVVVKVGDSADDDRITSVTGTYEGGGGGGLEYETGTYTPVTDEHSPTISFANTHSGRPMAVMLTDTDADSASSILMPLSWAIISWYDAFGLVMGTGYGYRDLVYTTSTGNLTSVGQFVNSLSGLTYSLSSSSFFPYSGNESRLYRAGKTYKWVAVWPPAV